MTIATNLAPTYLELLQEFPPRPIRSEEQFRATQAVIDSLIDRDNLTADEEDYLDVLGTLVYEYEKTLDLIPDLYGVDLLKALIAESDYRQKDLVPIFKTESIVSEVLSGKRKLSTEHIRQLAEFFHISPAAFFPRDFSGINDISSSQNLDRVSSIPSNSQMPISNPNFGGFF